IITQERAADDQISKNDLNLFHIEGSTFYDTLKNIVEKFGPNYYDYNDLISSSILDTHGSREAAEKAAREKAEGYGSENYGKKPMNQSQERTSVKRTLISDINASRTGETVNIRARVQTSRPTSSKLAFFVFRQQNATIQGVLTVDEKDVSKGFVKFAS
ncbi:6124_t:CDS:2, partial [Entrophospora sp. SA101]